MNFTFEQQLFRTRLESEIHIKDLILEPISGLLQLIIILQKEIKEQQLVDQEDDDGWIKVTKSGKQPSFSRTETGEIKLRAKLKRKQEKEKV